MALAQHPRVTMSSRLLGTSPGSTTAPSERNGLGCEQMQPTRTIRGACCWNAGSLAWAVQVWPWSPAFWGGLGHRHVFFLQLSLDFGLLQENDISLPSPGTHPDAAP